ncbi:MAG: hypothetical protein JXQ65_05980, partial [Candidatus Marinimicrobia bacterium]|nr:hypothetical protein [Candidatus Neomarinimicrobiota bacterium]
SHSHFEPDSSPEYRFRMTATGNNPILSITKNPSPGHPPSLTVIPALFPVILNERQRVKNLHTHHLNPFKP